MTTTPNSCSMPQRRGCVCRVLSAYSESIGFKSRLLQDCLSSLLLCFSSVPSGIWQESISNRPRPLPNSLRHHHISLCYTIYATEGVVKLTINYISVAGGTRWRSWLRHCATSRKVAGSIPDVVIGIFHWHNPSGRTMALGSTQPLTEKSTRNISWAGVKAAGA